MLHRSTFKIGLILRRFGLYALPLCLLASQATAQTTTPEQTQEQASEQLIEPIKANYQVELLIFSQLYSQTNERWPHNPVLNYPENLLLLAPIEQEQLDQQALNSQALTPTKPTSTELTDQLSRETLTNYQPQAYRFLNASPDPALFFHGAALRLKAKGSRILFHQRWQQNIDSEIDHIAIQGGEQFGQQYELAGNISLRRGRYLHIKTNLWLSQFSDNEALFEKPWTQLPAIPTLASLSEQQNAFELAPKSQAQTPNFETTDDQAPSQDQAASPEQHQEATEINNPLEPETAPLYSQKHGDYWLKQIVLLQDKRRMRSLENHYIDHPKFGVLVRFTPIKDEPIETNPLKTE